MRRILLANRAYFSVLHPIKSRTIHWRNKIRIYITIIRPILCYGCEAWMMTCKSEEMLDAFERKILRRIHTWKEDEVQHRYIWPV
jgi:Fe-S-cluster-containing dehydrogenase component